MALRPRKDEVIDHGADDISALVTQDDGQLVGEGGLTGGGRSVDSYPRWVFTCDGPNSLSRWPSKTKSLASKGYED